MSFKDTDIALFSQCPTRKEVDDYFQVPEVGTSKRNALSIFKIARKLLFIYCQEDKLVSFLLLLCWLTYCMLYYTGWQHGWCLFRDELVTFIFNQRPVAVSISVAMLIVWLNDFKPVTLFYLLYRGLRSFVDPYLPVWRLKMNLKWVYFYFLFSIKQLLNKVPRF